MESFVSRKARNTSDWGRRLVAIALSALTCASLTAHSQGRSVWEDFSTQMSGSDHSGNLGPDLFGDSTDLYTGATQFLVTDVSIPGNSALSVALQRSLEASDTGLGDGLPDSFLTWTRYEVPYLSGAYPEGWIATTQSMGHVVTDQRCTYSNGPREIPDDKGSQGEWMVYEYWHGNHLYVPGRGSQPMLVAAGGSPPTDGPTYRWMTKDHWYFVPAEHGERSTRRGVPGSRTRRHQVLLRPPRQLASRAAAQEVRR
jgi:hypothetical protein